MAPSMTCIILSLRKRMRMKNNKKRDLKNFLAYIKYQCGHGVSLDDALKNLGYVRTEKNGANSE